MVSLLISHPKCNLNDKDEDGWTALHFGEYLNTFKLAFLLILLFKASRGGHDQVVSLLINHDGFDLIDEKDGLGQTALHTGKYLN